MKVERRLKYSGFLDEQESSLVVIIYKSLIIDIM